MSYFGPDPFDPEEVLDNRVMPDSGVYDNLDLEVSVSHPTTTFSTDNVEVALVLRFAVEVASATANYAMQLAEQRWTDQESYMYEHLERLNDAQENFNKALKAFDTA